MVVPSFRFRITVPSGNHLIQVTFARCTFGNSVLFYGYGTGGVSSIAWDDCLCIGGAYVILLGPFYVTVFPAALSDGLFT